MSKSELETKLTKAIEELDGKEAFNLKLEFFKQGWFDEYEIIFIGFGQLISSKQYKNAIFPLLKDGYVDKASQVNTLYWTSLKEMEEPLPLDLLKQSAKKALNNNMYEELRAFNLAFPEARDILHELRSELFREGKTPEYMNLTHILE